MADQLTAQTSKESKGIFNRLKKVLRPGSPSTIAAPTITPLPASVLPPTDLVHVLIKPEEAAKLRARYDHFRILIIGRANAGKTTVLKRVCNTNEDPIYNKINPTSKRGIHNVYDEFSFQSNPQFIFHDSPGFEAGGEEELQDVLSFLQMKSKVKEVKDQIHAIWFCFTPNVSRPLLGLEQKFFNEQLGLNVPVVAIFTKFDDLITQVYDRALNDEENIRVACATLENKFEKPLKAYKFPPRAYMRFESLHEDEGNHQEQVGELIKQTAASIDNLALKMLFVTVQQNNLEVCIEYAVNEYVFQNSNTVEDLIYKATLWFGHSFLQNHDYGKTESTTTFGDGADRLDAGGNLNRNRFVKKILNVVDTQFNAPSMCSFTAILVCLEHSFWIAQQCSNPTDGFIKAWDIYLKTRLAMVDRDVDNYLRSKGRADWFTIKHRASDEECAEFRDIVLNNLLSRPKIPT